MVLMIVGDIRAEFTGTFQLVGGDGLTQAQGASGARFTYEGTDGGVAYSLFGRVWVPGTAGTYPGIITNHGASGGPTTQDSVADPMRDWGAITIAVTLEHCAASYETDGNQPNTCPNLNCNPGGTTAGASSFNTQRIMKTYDMLDNIETLFPTYSVDTTRVAVHGHSAGAYATTAALDANPTTFLVASHTGGGYDVTETFNYTPTASECDGITTPYSLNHGDTGTSGSPSGTDGTVPVAWDTALNGVLDGPHELNIYYSMTHSQSNNPPDNAPVLANIQDWYTTYGLFTAGSTPTCSGISISGVTIQ
jgi:dienelactone hydrolase